ncbi:ArsR/SmtB family transcription factor [Paraliobacillus salinarum]|uniref:ArsR/SmtB family transcription factor n=1 Tax=Paraliobacillus salinarum TaxID=1158996 RepID=UPI0015F3FEA6|nr:metalloregulator ArsR/SmtB family transcription factor [Paraliobacillus salinarum]
MKSTVKNTDEAKIIVNQSEQLLPALQEEVKTKEKADFYKALGDETRLRIIGMLLIDNLCMCEIVSGLNIPTSTISHHLKLLERGNIIRSQKEGRYTVYYLNKKTVLPFLQ